jgi:hypothetical protein
MVATSLEGGVNSDENKKFYPWLAGKAQKNQTARTKKRRACAIGDLNKKKPVRLI